MGSVKKRLIRNSRGFTLVELIIVMIVLGIMAALAIPKFFNMSEDAKYSAVQGALGGVRSAVANYYAKEAARNGTGTYPTLAMMTDGSTVLDGKIPDNPYGTANPKNTVTPATSAINTLGCGTTPAGTAWCYNATTGQFWAATDQADISITGHVKENTM